MDESEPLLNRPQPSSQPDQQKCFKACRIILTVVALESTVYFSYNYNLTYFLTSEPLCWQNEDINNIFWTAMFVGIGCLFGGWLSDSCVNMFISICIGYVFMLIPLVLITIQSAYLTPKSSSSSSWSNSNSTSHFGHSGTVHTTCNADSVEGNWYCFGPKCFISIFWLIAVTNFGAGILKVNFIVFGADQIVYFSEDDLRSYINGYYWLHNVGATLAGVLGQLAVWNGIQHFSGFFFVHIVELAILVGSLVIFVAGRGVYGHRPASGAVISRIFFVIKKAFGSCLERERFAIADRPPTFLDYASNVYDGEAPESIVEGIKSIWRIFKTLGLAFIYCFCYYQMKSLSTNQGFHMSVNLEASSTTYPSGYHSNCGNSTIGNGTDATVSSVAVSVLDIFENVSILLLIPLVFFVIYPMWRKHGYSFKIYQRLMVGELLAILSLISCGVVEIFRRKDLQQYGVFYQKLGTTYYDASPNTSIWWQILQYSLLGFSEVFFFLTCMEYLFIEAARFTQGFVVALYWMIGETANVLGVVIINYLVWTDDMRFNCDKLRLDTYFFILAGILGGTMAVTFLVAKVCDLHINIMIEARTLQFHNSPEAEHRTVAPNN